MKIPTRYLLALVLAHTIALWGCADDSFTGTRKENSPPDVWIAAGPSVSWPSSYRARFFWGGSDVDGVVIFYEYAISDDEPDGTPTPDGWSPVFRGDSTFFVSAGELPDTTHIDMARLEPVELLGRHSFFVRSVDNEGARSAEPAVQAFLAVNLSPVVDVLWPPGSGTDPIEVQPVTTFRWRGTDYVTSLQETQEPEAARWVLLDVDTIAGSWDGAIDYLRVTPEAREWSDWQPYGAASGAGTSWTSPTLAVGHYLFAVQVLDEAGAVSLGIDESRNVRKLVVTDAPTRPPSITIYCEGTDTFVVSTPDSIVDASAPANTDFTCCFKPDFPNAQLSGYRYGRDITNPDDDSQWDIPLTPFIGLVSCTTPVSFGPGVHTLHIEVVDAAGGRFRVTVRFSLV